MHLKILVPSAAAGAIIGKGGETIAQVQKDAGARVKMSKANDHYPGNISSSSLKLSNMKYVLCPICRFIISIFYIHFTVKTKYLLDSCKINLR